MASSHWIFLDVNGVREAFYIGCVRGLLKSLETDKVMSGIMWAHREESVEICTIVELTAVHQSRLLGKIRIAFRHIRPVNNIFCRYMAMFGTFFNTSQICCGRPRRKAWCLKNSFSSILYCCTLMTTDMTWTIARSKWIWSTNVLIQIKHQVYCFVIHDFDDIFKSTWHQFNFPSY